MRCFCMHDVEKWQGNIRREQKVEYAMQVGDMHLIGALVADKQCVFLRAADLTFFAHV